jgi:hypothetical protein
MRGERTREHGAEFRSRQWVGLWVSRQRFPKRLLYQANFEQLADSLALNETLDLNGIALGAYSLLVQGGQGWTQADQR